jgi:hypothetical protein
MTCCTRSNSVFSYPGAWMIPNISSTTARDKLPVAVSFSPPVSAARLSRIRALAVIADSEISASVRSGSSRIALLLPEGS